MGKASGPGGKGIYDASASSHSERGLEKQSVGRLIVLFHVQTFCPSFSRGNLASKSSCLLAVDVSQLGGATSQHHEVTSDRSAISWSWVARSKPCSLTCVGLIEVQLLLPQCPYITKRLSSAKALVGSPARHTKAPAGDVRRRHVVAKWSKKGSEQSFQMQAGFMLFALATTTFGPSVLELSCRSVSIRQCS